jgi:hypothetical protein
MGHHLQAQTFPKGNEGRVLSIRELLGDGRYRHSGHTGPGPRKIPVAAVRQRDDNSMAGVSVPYDGLVDGADSTPNLGLRPGGQR